MIHSAGTMLMSIDASFHSYALINRAHRNNHSYIIYLLNFACITLSERLVKSVIVAYRKRHDVQFSVQSLFRKWQIKLV